ncbi:8602_t:CDS:2, partial [Gigaspora margarita]
TTSKPKTSQNIWNGLRYLKQQGRYQEARHEVIKIEVTKWADKKENKRHDKIAEDGNCIKRCKGCRQKNTKGEKCTIKVNRETENYELVVDCKKRLRAEIDDIKALIEVKKSRKRTEKSNIENRIYIPRIHRNQELIDQGVINEKGRKILSAIMNEWIKEKIKKWNSGSR